MNICGVLVHAVPSRLASVVDALTAFDGVDVHRSAEGGRLVVTIEDTHSRAAIDTLRELHRVDGVVAASLIYHHFEPEDGASDEAAPTVLERSHSWPGKASA